MLTCYVLSKPFKPYLDLWLKERQEKGIESEWLFPDPDDPSKARSISALNSWANTFSRMLGIDWYWHAGRHRWATALASSGIPDDVIQQLAGWSNISLVQVYKDLDPLEGLDQYFKDGEIVAAQPTMLQGL